MSTRTSAATASTTDAMTTSAAGRLPQSVSKRLFGGSSTPLYPPSPDIEHLTDGEIRALKEVFARMEKFELEENERIRKLEQSVLKYEDMVRIDTANKGDLLKQSDIRLCRLCFSKRFDDGIGRVCVSCYRRVCSDCGSFSRPKGSTSSATSTGTTTRSKWRCNLCLMRRELVAASGLWFHGGLAHPVISSTSFKQKLHDDGGSNARMDHMHLERTHWRNYSSAALGIHSKYSSDGDMAPDGDDDDDAAAAAAAAAAADYTGRATQRQSRSQKSNARRSSQKKPLLSSFQDIFNRAVSHAGDDGVKSSPAASGGNGFKSDKNLAPQPVLSARVKSPGRAPQEGKREEPRDTTDRNPYGQYLTDGSNEAERYSKSVDGDKSPATLWKEASLEAPRRFSDGVFSSNGRPSRGRRGFTNYLTPYYTDVVYHRSDCCRSDKAAMDCGCDEGNPTEFLGPAYSDDDAHLSRTTQDASGRRQHHHHHRHPSPYRRNDVNDRSVPCRRVHHLQLDDRQDSNRTAESQEEEWYYEEDYNHQPHQQQQHQRQKYLQQPQQQHGMASYNGRQNVGRSPNHPHQHQQHHHTPPHRRHQLQQLPGTDSARQAIRQRHQGNRQNYHHHHHPHPSPHRHHHEISPSAQSHHHQHPPGVNQRQKMVARCQPQQLQSPVQSQYYDVKDKNSDGPQNYAEGEEDREDEEYDEGVGDTYDTYGYDYQRRRPSTPHQLGTETTPNRMNSCRVFDQDEMSKECEFDRRQLPPHWDSTCESDVMSPVQQRPMKLQMNYNLETRRQSVPVRIGHQEELNFRRKGFNTHPRSVSVCSSPRSTPDRSQQLPVAGEARVAAAPRSPRPSEKRGKETYERPDEDQHYYHQQAQYYQDLASQQRYSSFGQHQRQPHSPLLPQQRRSTRHMLYQEEINQGADTGYQQNVIPCMRSPITGSGSRTHYQVGTTAPRTDGDSEVTPVKSRIVENSGRRSSFASRQLQRDLSDIPDSETSQDVADEKEVAAEAPDPKVCDSRPRRRLSLAAQKSESIETEIEEFLRAKQQQQKRRESRSEEPQGQRKSSSSPDKDSEDHKRSGSYKLSRSGSRRQSRQRKMSVAAIATGDSLLQKRQDAAKRSDDIDQDFLLGHTPQPTRRRTRQRFMSEPAVKPLLPRDDNPLARHLLEKISRSDKYFKVELKMDSSKGSYHGFGLRLAEKKQDSENKKEIVVSDVVDGGTADMQGVNIGDQIVEWDGIQLQGKSLSEIKSLLAGCDKEVVEVIVKRPGKQESRKLHRTATASESKMEEIKQKLLTVLLEQEKSSNDRKTGTGVSHQGDTPEVNRSIEGSVTLQVKYDASSESLEIHIIRANDLPKRTGYLAEKSGKMPKPYLKMSFLPRSNGRHSCRSRALLGTCDPEWNQKFTLDAVSEEELNSLTLQLSVWDDGGLDSDVFYGELLLPCDSIDISGVTTLTLPLQDHDPATGPMPTPSPKYLLVKSRRKNNSSGATTHVSSNSGIQNENHDHHFSDSKKEESSRKGSASVASSSKEASSTATTTSKIEKITRRVSEFASKMKHDISSASGQNHKSPSTKKKGIFKIMSRRRMSMPVEKHRSSSLTHVKGKKIN